MKWNNSGDDDQGKACFPLELRRSLNFLLQLSLIWPLFPQSGHWIELSLAVATKLFPHIIWPLFPQSGHLIVSSQIAHWLNSRWDSISSRVEVLQRRAEQLVGPMPIEGSGSGNANRAKAAGEKFFCHRYLSGEKFRYFLSSLKILTQERKELQTHSLLGAMPPQMGSVNLGGVFCTMNVF